MNPANHQLQRNTAVIKEPFNLICHSLKILVIYRHFGFQQPTCRRGVIRKMRLKLSAIYLLTRGTGSLIHWEGLECAYTTCHHPLPGQPSQSEREVAGLRGPQGPSGTSDCCCSCQGNQERRCDHRWRFLSSLRMTLCWRKETVKG